MEYVLGQIILFAGHYVPLNFAPCDGRALPVNGNEGLFSLIGNTYGGDHINFNLPDLRGRVPLSQGQGVLDPKTGGGGALTNHALGAKGGVETVNLMQSHIPPHTHPLNTLDTPAVTSSPTNAMLATVPAGTAYYIADQPGGPTPVTVQLGSDSIANTGDGAPHANMMPVLAMSYIICTRGIYPNFP